MHEAGLRNRTCLIGQAAVKVSRIDPKGIPVRIKDNLIIVQGS